MKKLLKPVSLLLIAMMLICALPLSVSTADSTVGKGCKTRREALMGLRRR